MRLRLPLLILSAAVCAAPALAQAPAAPSAPTTPPPPWHTQIDLGWVLASGNSELSTLHLAEQVTYTVAPWKFTEDFSIVNASSNGTETANNMAANLRADYSFNPRLTGYGLGHYERDRFAGIAQRLRQELGLSWSALAVPTDTLKVEAGAGMTEEKPDSGVARNYASARAGANYRHMFRANTFFSAKGEYIQDLKDTGNQQVNAEVALVAPVSTHVAVKLGYAMRYNSQPLPPATKSTDTIASAGIQVVF